MVKAGALLSLDLNFAILKLLHGPVTVQAKLAPLTHSLNPLNAKTFGETSAGVKFRI